MSTIPTDDKSYTTKLTVEVDRDIYFAVTKTLHHGQLSYIVRTFFESFKNHKDEIFAWCFGKSPLHLPPKGELDHVVSQSTDGSD